jgi:hypothetical protein
VQAPVSGPWHAARGSIGESAAAAWDQLQGKFAQNARSRFLLTELRCLTWYNGYFPSPMKPSAPWMFPAGSS